MDYFQHMQDTAMLLFAVRPLIHEIWNLLVLLHFENGKKRGHGPHSKLETSTSGKHILQHSADLYINSQASGIFLLTCCDVQAILVDGVLIFIFLSSSDPVL